MAVARCWTSRRRSPGVPLRIIRISAERVSTCMANLATSFSPDVESETPATLYWRCFIRLKSSRKTSCAFGSACSRTRKGVEIGYQEDPELDLDNLSLLSDVFTATDSGRGCVLVPAREGLLVPADSGLNFTHRFDTSRLRGLPHGHARNCAVRSSRIIHVGRPLRRGRPQKRGLGQPTRQRAPGTERLRSCSENQRGRFEFTCSAKGTT